MPLIGSASPRFPAHAQLRSKPPVFAVAEHQGTLPSCQRLPHGSHSNPMEQMATCQDDFSAHPRVAPRLRRRTPRELRQVMGATFVAKTVRDSSFSGERTVNNSATETN